MAAFELYNDSRGDYRWRLKHANGQTIATGGEGYSSRSTALAGIESVKKNAPAADVKDLTSDNGDNGDKAGAVSSAPSSAEGAGRLS